MHANCSTRSLAWVFAFAVSSFSVGCVSARHSGGSGGSGGGDSSGTGGSASGAGGAHASGGSTGAGGTTSGSGGSTIGGAGGAGLGTGGATAGACPSNATFCSGFEQPGMPPGSTYRFNAAPGEWTRDFAIDTSKFKNGAASLRVKPSTEAGTSGSAYKMLAVPATSGMFWVRFYIMSDLPIGQADAGGDGLHNAFTEAAASDDPNDGTVLEFAQDVGIAFNSHDMDRWPDGYGRLTAGGTKAYTLPENMWHCVEISFDSQVRTQSLYVNGAQLINATNYPDMMMIASPFDTFRFGFVQIHGPARTVWYDDVVVAPTRVGCP